MAILDKQQSIVKSILLHINEHFLALYDSFDGATDLSLSELYTYNLWFNRYRLSMGYGKHGKNGKCYFDGQHFYVATKYKDFRKNPWLPNSNDAISKIINDLVDAGLIIKTKKERYLQIRIIKWENIITKGISVPTRSTNSEKQRARSPKSREIYKGYSSKHSLNSSVNTINTDNGRKAPKSKSRTFRKSDPLTDWVDSAKHGGLTLGASNCIADFCSKSYKYNPEDHCHNIYRIIEMARGHEIKQVHKKNKKINKDLIPFESNGMVRSSLEAKLRKVFSKVTKSKSNKLTVNHYDKYLMKSLKNFFYEALGLKEQKVVNPESKISYQNISNNSYGKRKPIHEKMPQWYYDQQAGKEKAKPASNLLNKLNQARNAYDIVVMQADDPTKPSPNHDRVVALKKRLNHYQKLYDAKQEVAKPKTKSENHKQAKQPKGLKKTLKALHNEIQARLRRLGEE